MAEEFRRVRLDPIVQFLGFKTLLIPEEAEEDESSETDSKIMQKSSAYIL